MVVALGVLSVVVGLAGSGIFQVISFQRFWQDDLTASVDLRRAGSRFAGDALNAEDARDSLGQRVGCAPGVPASSSVVLSWSDTVNGTHTASYSISGGSLIRDFDGRQNKLARRVVAGSLQVSLCQRLLTLDLQVEAGRGSVESIRLQTYLRKLILQ
ncbi:MAG: hypothetical protein IIC99_00650 [Chloroflexi bacterium]|nr:hypothetical protein [Chloroflexota bacterium]